MQRAKGRGCSQLPACCQHADRGRPSTAVNIAGYKLGLVRTVGSGITRHRQAHSSRSSHRLRQGLLL